MQTIILVGVVALASIGAWTAYREKVREKTGHQGDCVLSLECSQGRVTTPVVSRPVAAPVPVSPSSKHEPACFVAGTPVLTPRGLVAIEELAVGDEVVTMHDHTHEPGVRRLTQVFHHEQRGIARLVLEDERGTAVQSLDVTPEHPFYVPGFGFAPVSDLVPGVTQVQRADASRLTVRSVQQLAQTADVFNLEVDEFHTYFVGDSNVWVHNQYGGVIGAMGVLGGDNPSGQSFPLAEIASAPWGDILWLWRNAQPVVPAPGATSDIMRTRATHPDGRAWSRPNPNSPWRLVRGPTPVVPQRVEHYNPQSALRPQDTPTVRYVPPTPR